MKEGKTCKICAKTFTRRNYLRKHMETIHSKRYSCPICSRYFAEPTDHSCATKDGRFNCYVEKCSLKFSNGMSLRLHVRDGHKKIDENIVTGRAFKTKKAARDMVKMLCKKINVLSASFDELKYQMENMTDFLKTIGYELPIYEIPRKNFKHTNNADNDDDMVDYFDYNEEELIEEVFDDDIKIDNDEDFQLENRNTETNKIRTITLFPKTQARPSSLSQTKIRSKLVPEKMSTITVPNIVENPLPAIYLPPVARLGATTKKHNPFKFKPIKIPNSRPFLHKSATEKFLEKPTTTAAEEVKDTPPLFLKIQYDTETEVCKTDPKITFHFDTRPPDNDDEEFIVPT